MADSKDSQMCKINYTDICNKKLNSHETKTVKDNQLQRTKTFSLLMDMLLMI